MFLAGMAMTAWAIVPAPPVNQTLGMEDTSFDNLTAAECRVCHVGSQADRHHLLVGQDILPDSLVPNPDADGDGVDDVTYDCLNCHDMEFNDVTGTWGLVQNFRDCTECHNTGTPHHTTADALARNCVACHGDLIDNFDDGHYIPTYAPSPATPARSFGYGEPLNSRNNGAGACDYCHDDDGLSTRVILTNYELHHGTGLYDVTPEICFWCHDFGLPFDEQIRICEECHGPDTLHSIQADSPNPANLGTIVVGGEDAGYGHVGRDQGPGDSDCWGCHGFAVSGASAPGSGPVIPSVVGIDVSVMNAGANRVVFVAGSAFTNTAGATQFVSDVALTGADGSSVILAPYIIDQAALTVTIPGSTAPGNYNLQVVKAEFASNPAVISIIPAPVVTDLTCADGTATITGSGFAGYAEGSGTSVTRTVTTTTTELVYAGEQCNKKGRCNPVYEEVTTTTTETEVAAIFSWNDTRIVATFSACPDDVTVNSIYGSTISGDGGGTTTTTTLPPTGSCSDYGNEDSCNADSACEWRTNKKGRGSCRDAR
jgi:hypothetical protein